MKATKRILMTLVAMIGLTSVWAQSASYQIKEFVPPTSWESDATALSEADLPEDFVSIDADDLSAVDNPGPATGYVYLAFGFEGSKTNTFVWYNNEKFGPYSISFTRKTIYNSYTSGEKVYYTASTDAAPEVTWDAATNTGTFTMPASDVELEIEYYDELNDGDEDDNTTLLASLDGSTTDIYLNRTLAKEKWYTLCLPFDVDLTAEGPLKDVTAKTLSKVENDGATVTLTFGDAVTSLVAGTPYIVRLPEGAVENITDPLFEGAIISKDLVDVAVEGGTFKGTYARVDWTAADKNILFLQNDQFHYPNAAAWVNAFRGYIELDENVPAEAKVILDFGDDEATGIETVEADSQLSTVNSQLEGVWYTVQGVQLDGKPTEKGIYIVNGKKVAIQ